MHSYYTMHRIQHKHTQFLSHTHISTHMHAHVHIHMHTYTRSHMQTRFHTRPHTLSFSLCVLTHLLTSLPSWRNDPLYDHWYGDIAFILCVCIFEYAYISLSITIYVHKHSHTHTRIYTHAHAPARTCTRTHMNICTHLFVDDRTHHSAVVDTGEVRLIHKRYMHTHTQTRTQTQHILTQTLTLTRACTHTPTASLVRERSIAQQSMRNIAFIYYIYAYVYT